MKKMKLFVQKISAHRVHKKFAVVHTAVYYMFHLIRRNILKLAIWESQEQRSAEVETEEVYSDFIRLGKGG